MTTILFIFEGTRIEPNILTNLENCFFSNTRNQKRISICFGTDIFEWYNTLKDGNHFIDPFLLLKERNPNSFLEIDSSDDIAATYLFFDHDIHANKGITYAEKTVKITELLNFFDNETEEGLLFISYPMIEAYKDWNETGKDCFSCLTDTTQNTGYKEKVHSRHANHDNQAFFTYEKWVFLSCIMLSRSLFLVAGNQNNISYDYVQDKITQLAIFHSQNTKFVLPHNHVVILSPIPFFLCIELGRSFYDKHIKDSLHYLECNHSCISLGKIPSLFL